ncbi:MAG TPA: hypothetical protein DEA47_05140 [Peptococcaceae bacterium]|nr:MAG: 3D domain protein [Clostridia bacterium 41_269]HBT20728.1 hypothetical protein [Peptococcaceae bacterium]
MILRVRKLDTYTSDGETLTKKKNFFVSLLAVLIFTMLFIIYTATAKGITLNINGETRYVTTHCRTVEKVLKKEGIKLGPQYIVEPSSDSIVHDGGKIVVKKLVPVAVIDGNKKKIIRVEVPSVLEVLVKEGIVLSQGDEIKANLHPKDGSMPYIKIIRQDMKVITLTEEIPYKTKEIKDYHLTPGSRRIVQEGSKGLKETKVRITYKNGKEIGREKIKTEIIKNPVPRIVAVGDRSGVFVSRGERYIAVKKMTMIVSAYTHTGNPTATGDMPTRGTIAVDPRVIPLGTKLYVEGYGYGTALDTGGGIKGARLDVFFESKKQALEWGRKKVQVIILKEI